MISLPADPPFHAARCLPALLAERPGELSELLALARQYPPLRIAVAHPCDTESMAGVKAAMEAGYIDPVLVGPRAKLVEIAAAIHFDLRKVQLEDVEHSHAAAVRAVEMAASGTVAALMKGSLHTDELMSAVVASGSGLRTARRLSHCFLMHTRAYSRPFIITDAAINIVPTLDEKADIVRNAVELAHLLGLAEPRVAILCAVEMINSAMRSTLDAAALCKMADRGQISGALIDGPLAFDNAVSATAARIKGIVSQVAGQADIFMVPDLEAGNILAKQFEFLGGATSAGIVLGARVPIVLTSRADTLEARLASCALAVLANGRRRIA